MIRLETQPTMMRIGPGALVDQDTGPCGGHGAGLDADDIGAGELRLDARKGRERRGRPAPDLEAGPSKDPDAGRVGDCLSAGELRPDPVLALGADIVAEVCCAGRDDGEKGGRGSVGCSRERLWVWVISQYITPRHNLHPPPVWGLKRPRRTGDPGRAGGGGGKQPEVEGTCGRLCELLGRGGW